MTGTDGHSTDAGKPRGRPGRRGRRAAPPATVTDERVRQEECYRLRLSGLTFAEIADSPHPNDPDRKLYADSAGSSRAFRTAMERHAGHQDSEEARALWEARAERALVAIWPQVTSGDLAASGAFSRLMSEVGKVLGLSLHRVDLHQRHDTGEWERVLGQWEEAVRTAARQDYRRELIAAGLLTPDAPPANPDDPPDPITRRTP